MRRLITSQVAGFPATFWWLWAGALLSALASFVFVFLAVYLTARGFDARTTGLLVSAMGVGTLAAGPIGGALADRIGRKPTLLAALLATAASAAFLGAVRAPAAIAAGVLGFGLSTATIFPAVRAMVADLVAPADRTRAFALLYWANNLGAGLSAAVGGAVGERSWLGLFLADATTTLVFAAVVWRRVPETRPAPAAPGAGSATAPARGYGAVLRDRPFVAFALVFVAFITVFWQFAAAAPIAMTRAGLRPAEIGRVLAVNGFLIVVLTPLVSRAVARLDPAHVLAVGALAVGAGYGAYALCDGPAGFAAATAVWTLGEIASLPVAAALVASLSPPDLRGRYQGIYALSFGAGQTLAPIVGGSVLEAAGPAVLWPSCLGAMVVVAGAHLALGAGRRSAASRTSEAP
ncbi:MDR family MFS transporter [Anaeromyxobacter oryzae]|uniref:MFS transporter n=1 Tax=Anaeromyxobacter oryzae TaxID=2918170 RepID=A0ABM7X134_9BACT|nr:MFS transporter [Anaeromyxobacter oryzae]BDG05507.1 MFS transporter [Anaeromyxobacter oryzae]